MFLDSNESDVPIVKFDSLPLSQLLVGLPIYSKKVYMYIYPSTALFPGLETSTYDQSDPVLYGRHHLLPFIRFWGIVSLNVALVIVTFYILHFALLFCATYKYSQGEVY